MIYILTIFACIDYLSIFSRRDFFDIFRIDTNMAFWKERNDVLDPSLKCTSYDDFRYNLVPSALRSLKTVIENKLNQAFSISLIVDIWVNKTQSDFIALGASIINENMDREILIINMRRLKCVSKQWWTNTILIKRRYTVINMWLIIIIQLKMDLICFSLNSCCVWYRFKPSSFI
jgi:hypothetical protein